SMNSVLVRCAVLFTYLAQTLDVNSFHRLRKMGTTLQYSGLYSRPVSRIPTSMKMMSLNRRPHSATRNRFLRYPSFAWIAGVLMGLRKTHVSNALPIYCIPFECINRLLKQKRLVPNVVRVKQISSSAS